MVIIKSNRAKALLVNSKAFDQFPVSQMRKYPGHEWNIWVKMERDLQNVKNLSFSGLVEDYEKILLEALSCLAKDRPLSAMENLSLRECEAYLRDRNSENALENLGPSDEVKFKKLLTWLRSTPHIESTGHYQYPSSKGSFSGLKLVDKIRELKAFLASHEVQGIYQESLLPELVDVEDLTVFIQVPYSTNHEKSMFEDLHALGVATFQEESLNFIPDA
jgi:hypothetical protein